MKRIMKSIRTLIAFIGIGFSCPLEGATLLLDDFSTGSFFLERGDNGTASFSDSFATPLTDQRTINGVGFPNWTLTLGSGGLVYDVDSLEEGRNYMYLEYSSSGTFSILGYDAFAVDLINVVGTGELIVAVSGSGGNNVRVPISESGTVVSPFSFLDTSRSLDSLSAMSFRFNTSSEDFSATIDNIRLIPEPSAPMMLLTVATVLIGRRARCPRS
jgi:hypothetical protein